MDFYEQAAATALSLLTRYGKDAPIRRVGKDYDPAAGEVTESAKLEGTIKVLVLPVSNTPKGIFVQADNKLLESLIAGKSRFIIAAAKGAPFEPVATDIIEVGGESFTVIGCTPLAPTGVPILYKIAAEIAPATPSSESTLNLGATEAAVQELQNFVADP